MIERVLDRQEVISTQGNNGMPHKLGIVMVATKFYANSDMGGLEQFARRLFQYLSLAEYRVFVLTRNYDGLASREVVDGVHVYRFPLWGSSKLAISLGYMVQALVWMIVHRHEYQIVHCHQSYAPATIGALTKLLLGKPVLVKISTSDEFSERRELERLPLFRLRRFLLQRVDRFVSVNNQARIEFVDMGIDPTRIVHIPNGVPIPSERAFDVRTRQMARERLGLAWERITIFAGRLSAEKNLSTLIDAWPLVLVVYPDAHLLLVGDGGTFRNVEPQLRHQVAVLGLRERVHFIGRVQNVLDFLLTADLFVLPSSTEGMSNALLEAMAAGLPVVATRIPGNVGLINEDENGLLIEKLDVEGLASAIIDLFASPETASRLARTARRTAEDRFGIRQVSEQYLALYNALLKELGVTDGGSGNNRRHC